MKGKITCNKNVLPLLVELDDLINKRSIATKRLADPTISNQEAIDVSRQRMTWDAAIIGCAWRINKASKGEK
jgi:hypothetical protein